MSVFLISYDLRKPDFDYEPLYGALDEIRAKRVQDSVWGVRSADSASQVFDYLWQHMHSARDRLFVVPFDYGDKNYKGKNSINMLKSI
jgi:hypothetical protein